MTLLGLVLRSARFFWRSHVGVFLGAILATAIITGALSVGDSVRHSLERMAQARLGRVELALHSPGRFFRAKLGADLSGELSTAVAPVMLLRGTATGEKADGSGGGDVRVGRVQVLGVTPDFWRLATNQGGREPELLTNDGAEGVALNERLARSLGVSVGDEVILRVDKPSLLSRDAPLSTIEDATVLIRLPITAIVADGRLGRFSLDANQVPPYNAFLTLSALQKLVGMEARANTLLVHQRGGRKLEPAEATSALWKHWEFADSGLELRDVPGQKLLELRTNRVFLDPPIADAALRATPGAKGVLTYFVNELRVGDRATPYSTVAALQGPLIPPGMADDEAVINQWFADDVGAKVGDKLTLTYYLVGPMRRLEQHSNVFRIRSIVPMTGPARDPALMPDIPGLSDKKDCRDWEPGVPVDLDRIRDKDQKYWDVYRGTPKVFLTLTAGQRIWNNRFGDLTAVRYASANPEARNVVETCLRQALNPASQGLFFLPVRERAARASAESLDFGQLFLGFSFFLIIAALLLTALLFAFAIEQRAEEVGTLLAFGFRPRSVQQLLLLEGGVIAFVAGVLGVGLATFYTRGIIAGLSSVWSGAVADAALLYHATPQTLLIGGLSGFAMALLSIFLVTRRQAKAPARELLAGGSESESRWLGQSRGKWLPGVPTILVSSLLAVVLVLLASGSGESGAGAGYFFGAGAFLLIGSIAACRAFLAQAERREAGGVLTLGSLATRNAVRRTGRSLGAITLLACGSFLVVAVGANRHDPGADAGRRNSGTGGFALYGESALPVYSDLNTAAGRGEFGLDAAALGDAKIVAVRLREGDDASCLNLNRAQTPRLLGIATEEFQSRKAFTFAETLGGTVQDPWRLLDQGSADGTIPVVGDTNTVVWSLGKKLGDTVPYTDDRGNTYRLKIVGVLANSIVQGGLILSENNFVRLFPSQSGYQVFLVDAVPASAANVSRELTQGLENVGLSLLPTAERLAAFNTVEDTYLSIFAILGGLGLLLGSAGLGVIVLRNVWDRRGELALLRAVGFRQDALFRLLFREHALLLMLGLAAGIASALVAILPALRSPGAEIPYLSLGMTLLAVFVSGFVFTALATAVALRSRLIDALRNE
ncbi:MAG: FtsX-like permease family protein [Fibrella sp.]|nr:FtsX-like permease family protein [Armatimonadota bacterium]